MLASCLAKMLECCNIYCISEVWPFSFSWVVVFWQVFQFAVQIIMEGCYCFLLLQFRNIESFVYLFFLGAVFLAKLRCSVLRWLVSLWSVHQSAPHIDLVTFTSCRFFLLVITKSVRCHHLEQGCIHVVLFYVGIRKKVFMIASEWTKHSLRSWPLLLQLPMPCLPMTPYALMRWMCLVWCVGSVRDISRLLTPLGSGVSF